MPQTSWVDKPQGNRYNAARSAAGAECRIDPAKVSTTVMSQTPSFDHPESGSVSSAGQSLAPGRWQIAGRTITASALLVGIIVCVLGTALVVATTGGVVAGQSERRLRATQTTAADIGLQFQLGIADMNQGNYELAALRFRWILERDPNYPGAVDWLGVAERILNGTNVPQPTAMPSSSAVTLDERFAEAKALFDSQQWEVAIARLQEIQAIDPRFREVEVQQMLYEALKTLGLIYVRGDRIEEGIILFDQAEKIQPLDDQTAGERYFAILYVTGKTYWGLNWPVVIDNFEAIHQLAPAYRDVTDRLREAYIAYGDLLTTQGQPCDGAEQYQAAQAMRNDSAVAEKYNLAREACLNPSPTPSPTPLPGIPTPTLEPGTIPTPAPPTSEP